MQRRRQCRRSRCLTLRCATRAGIDAHGNAEARGDAASDGDLPSPPEAVSVWRACARKLAPFPTAPLAPWNPVCEARAGHPMRTIMHGAAATGLDYISKTHKCRARAQILNLRAQAHCDVLSTDDACFFRLSAFCLRCSQHSSSGDARGPE